MCYCKPPFEAVKTTDGLACPVCEHCFLAEGKPRISNLGSSTLLAPPKGKVDERIMLLPSIYVDHLIFSCCIQNIARGFVICFSSIYVSIQVIVGCTPTNLLLWGIYGL